MTQAYELGIFKSVVIGFENAVGKHWKVFEKSIEKSLSQKE